MLIISLMLVALLVALLIPLSRTLFRGARPSFDGERAYEQVVRQVAFGPRVPGTEAHRQTRAYLVETLGAYAARVSEQTFTYRDRLDSTRTYEGANIMASFNLDPKTPKRVMLAAHWDSRPFADQDPDPANRRRPVPGANDGASGVAVLLEMARLLHETPPDIGVDIVLFDMEDLGDDPEQDSVQAGNPFAIGSEYFAAGLPQYRPAFGILLDMVGDRNLRIPKETYSTTHAEAVVEKVWAAAERVGASAFLDEQGSPVYDDHIAFLRRGIPVIDLIHTPFPSYWHTVDDTPDKISPASLQQVGDVLVEVIYSE